MAEHSRPINIEKSNELAQSNCPRSLWLCKLLPNSGCAVVLPGVLVGTQFSGSSPRDALIQCVLGEAEESGFLVNISGDLDPARNRAAIWELRSRGLLLEKGPRCLHLLSHTAYVAGSSLTDFKTQSSRAQPVGRYASGKNNCVCTDPVSREVGK